MFSHEQYNKYKNIIKRIHINMKIKEEKIKAKDFYCFNQRELFEIIKGKNFANMQNKLSQLINISLKSYN